MLETIFLLFFYFHSKFNNNFKSHINLGLGGRGWSRNISYPCRKSSKCFVCPLSNCKSGIIEIQSPNYRGKRFSATVSVFQDFRLRYCRWAVCENGEEEDERDSVL
jgi:hypothetical protein